MGISNSAALCPKCGKLPPFCEHIKRPVERAPETAKHKPLYRPAAMVLEYQPELTHSVWIDYISEDAGTRQQLIDELKAGVKEGRWLGWRLILVEQEVIGNQ